MCPCLFRVQCPGRSEAAGTLLRSVCAKIRHHTRCENRQTRTVRQERAGTSRALTQIGVRAEQLETQHAATYRRFNLHCCSGAPNKAGPEDSGPAESDSVKVG